MDMIANPVLFGAGLLCLLFGLWLFFRSGRSVVDDAKSAAYEAVKNRDLGAMRQQVEGAMAGVSGDDAISSGAKKLAGLAAREAMVRVKRIAGLIFVVGGLVLSALGALWH